MAWLLTKTLQPGHSRLLLAGCSSRRLMLLEGQSITFHLYRPPPTPEPARVASVG